MIPVLSAEQLREADTHTIAQEHITAVKLMERAAMNCAGRLMELLPYDTPVAVLAGMGNNGGDGLAIARILRNSGQKEVQVFIPRHRSAGSPDFETNLERAQRMGIPVEFLEEGAVWPAFRANAVVIDALFGSGLQRPITGWLKDLVRGLNACPNPVIAIDMPSGLFAYDNSANDPQAIVEAERTLTLELPKWALLMADHYRFAGQWEVVEIGLDRSFMATLAPQAWLLEAADVAALLPVRNRIAHKGNHGHAWLLAGGPGKMGAALLAAKACLRSGCGLLTVRVPAGQEAVVHGGIPEAMVSSDDAGQLEHLPHFGRVDAIGIGPGMGTSDGTGRLLKHILQEAPAPMVLDADALNLLAENRTWLAFLPPGAILTPHPKELERLVGKASSDQERLEQARGLARRHQVVVVLKGAYTAICAQDGRIFFNATGNPGMAKGGSGDALTGILTGLLAQGMPPLAAALAGTHAHGMAGDLAAAQLGMDGMLPSDLIGQLPAAWKKLRRGTGPHRMLAEVI